MHDCLWTNGRTIVWTCQNREEFSIHSQHPEKKKNKHLNAIESSNFTRITKLRKVIGCFQIGNFHICSHMIKNNAICLDFNFIFHCVGIQYYETSRLLSSERWKWTEDKNLSRDLCVYLILSSNLCHI